MSLQHIISFSISFFAIIAIVNCSKSRIVGGNFAKEGQFPHQISLQLNNRHVCGGSIIGPRHILTAAHCVVWSDKELISADMLSIRAGSNILGIDGQVRQAEKIYVHEKYLMNLNDVAIIVLSEPLKFNEKIQPIEMDKENAPDGVEVTISGWGKTANKGGSSVTLKYAILNVISVKQCGKRTGLAFNQIVCLDHPAGTGACQGDSGGPAVYNDKLIGVASFVIKTCGTDKPDAYARVSLYYDWIVDKMSL